jgi:hypothetical protein
MQAISALIANGRCLATSCSNGQAGSLRQKHLRRLAVMGKKLHQYSNIKVKVDFTAAALQHCQTT